MGSGKKGGGEISGNYPVSAEDNVMMIHDFGEMNLDAGDWLMINNESGVRARDYNHNHPKVSANQPPKAWVQPGMLNQPPKSWGQPPMPGRPHTHDHISWGNFHPTPTAGFMPRPPPPNFVGNSYNGLLGRNPVGLAPWSHGQNFNARVGDDGTRLNGGSKRPLVVDSDDNDEYDEEDEEVEESYSGSKAKNVIHSKTPTKGVHQGLTSDSRGHPGVAPKPNMNKNYGPSAASHPGVGYYGWRPAGGGMPPIPVAHFPPPPFPPPPSRPVGNFAVGDKKRSSEKTAENIPKKNSFDGRDGTKFDDDFDDEFDDEEDMISVEDEDTHKNESDRIKSLIREHMNLNPRPGIPPPEFKHSWNLNNGGGSSQRQAYCNPHINEKKSPISRDIAEEIRQHNLAMESYRKKHLPQPFLREEKFPHNSNPTPGATSYKTGAKNAGKEVEIPSELESTDFDDEEESEFDDDANDEVVARPELVNGKSEKSGKHMEVKFAKQISQTPKDPKKEVKQSCKPQKEQCGEATDVCAGELIQMKAEKSTGSNVHVSFFEDYKRRVKEVAKLVKFHITPKPEVDACATDKELLMRIHEEKLEMKKRHQKEEQKLEKQFTAALRRFMEKQTTVDADSDASSDL